VELHLHLPERGPVDPDFSAVEILPCLFRLYVKRIAVGIVHFLHSRQGVGVFSSSFNSRAGSEPSRAREGEVEFPLVPGADAVDKESGLNPLDEPLPAPELLKLHGNIESRADGRRCEMKGQEAVCDHVVEEPPLGFPILLPAGDDLLRFQHGAGGDLIGFGDLLGGSLQLAHDDECVPGIQDAGLLDPPAASCSRTGVGSSLRPVRGSYQSIATFPEGKPSE